jgi:hypothetical protein
MTQQTTPGRRDDRLQEAAGDIAQRTSETVGRTLDGQLDSQVSRAGGVLTSVAEAIRRGGEELRDQQPQVASVADTAAAPVERFGDHVRQSSPRDLVHEVEQFARQQPAVFVGGAFLVGAIAARLLKASPVTGSGVNAGYRGSSAYGNGSSTYGSGSPTYGSGSSAYGSGSSYATRTNGDDGF